MSKEQRLVALIFSIIDNLSILTALYSGKNEHALYLLNWLSTHMSEYDKDSALDYVLYYQKHFQKIYDDYVGYSANSYFLKTNIKSLREFIDEALLLKDEIMRDKHSKSKSGPLYDYLWGK
jgi:hypothetical protein